MKIPKKALALILSSALLYTCAVYAEGFKDTKPTEWYMAHVNKLVSLGGVTGYEDGTFRPAGTITKAEFVSMLVRSMGYTPEPVTSGHWSQGVFKIARDKGLLKASELNMYVDAPITRNDMALLATRALEVRKEALPSDSAQYAASMKDYSQVPAEYKDYVLKAVATGIITGYPDKTFGGTKTLTRAEASVVVMRVLDPTLRKVVEKPSATGQIKPGETKPVEEVITKGVEHIRMPGLFINYKTITLLEANPYQMVVTKKLGSVFIEIKGNVSGDMGFMKGSEMFGSVPGTYYELGGYTYFSVDNGVSSVDYKTPDYFGFVLSDTDNLEIFPNPFKE